MGVWVPGRPHLPASLIWLQMNEVSVRGCHSRQIPALQGLCRGQEEEPDVGLLLDFVALRKGGSTHGLHSAGSAVTLS